MSFYKNAGGMAYPTTRLELMEEIGIRIDRGQTNLNDIDTSKITDMSYLFCYCRSLISIPLLDTTKVTDMNNILLGCEALTYLGGFKNLHISVTSGFLDSCPDLTVESLMNVINNLATAYNGRLSFGSINLSKLTAEQIAVATNKGWTLTT